MKSDKQSCCLRDLLSILENSEDYCETVDDILRHINTHLTPIRSIGGKAEEFKNNLEELNTQLSRLQTQRMVARQEDMAKLMSREWFLKKKIREADENIKKHFEHLRESRKYIYTKKYWSGIEGKFGAELRKALEYNQTMDAAKYLESLLPSLICPKGDEEKGVESWSKFLEYVCLLSKTEDYTAVTKTYDKILDNHSIAYIKAINYLPENREQIEIIKGFLRDQEWKEIEKLVEEIISVVNNNRISPEERLKEFKNKCFPLLIAMMFSEPQTFEAIKNYNTTRWGIPPCSGLSYPWAGGALGPFTYHHGLFLGFGLVFEIGPGLWCRPSIKNENLLMKMLGKKVSEVSKYIGPSHKSKKGTANVCISPVSIKSFINDARHRLHIKVLQTDNPVIKRLNYDEQEAKEGRAINIFQLKLFRLLASLLDPATDYRIFYQNCQHWVSYILRGTGSLTQFEFIWKPVRWWKGETVKYDQVHLGRPQQCANENCMYRRVTLMGNVCIEKPYDSVNVPYAQEKFVCKTENGTEEVDFNADKKYGCVKDKNFYPCDISL